MPYQALTSDVREEALNVLPIDFPDVEIQKEQSAAYDFLRLRIGDYDANTPYIDAIKKLEIILAAYFVIRPFAPDKANSYLEMFKQLIETIELGLTGPAADIDFKFAFTDYGSWPLAFKENPDTETRPYKSTNVFVPP